MKKLLLLLAAVTIAFGTVGSTFAAPKDKKPKPCPPCPACEKCPKCC